MNILLLNSPNSGVTIRTMVFPLGLAYIGTFLQEHGHYVRLVDLNVYRDYSQKLRNILQENRFEFIGVSFRNLFFNQISQIHYLNSIIKMIKVLSPHSKIIVGGPAFSLLSHEIMNSIREIDVGVIGRGEEAFLELTNKSPKEVKGIIYRDNGNLHSTSSREEIDLDNLPIPKRNWPDLDLSEYEMLNLQTRQGCSFRCKYCIYRKLFEIKKLKCRSVTSLEKEIDYLSSLGIKKIFFVDNAFNYPLGYSLEIIDILTKYNLEWAAFFRVANLLTKDYVKKLLESKCKIVINSVESGSQVMLNHLNSDNSIDSILTVLRLSPFLVKNKVSVIFTVVIGMPHERIRDLIMTFLLIIRILVRRCTVHVDLFFDPTRSKIRKEGSKIKIFIADRTGYKKIIYFSYLFLNMYNFIIKPKISSAKILRKTH